MPYPVTYSALKPMRSAMSAEISSNTPGAVMKPPLSISCRNAGEAMMSFPLQNLSGHQIYASMVRRFKTQPVIRKAEA